MAPAFQSHSCTMAPKRSVHTQISPLDQSPLASAHIYQTAHLEARYLATCPDALRLIELIVNFPTPEGRQRLWDRLVRAVRARLYAEGPEAEALRRAGDQELQRFAESLKQPATLEGAPGDGDSHDGTGQQLASSGLCEDAERLRLDLQREFRFPGLERLLELIAPSPCLLPALVRKVHKERPDPDGTTSGTGTAMGDSWSGLPGPPAPQFWSTRSRLSVPSGDLREGDMGATVPDGGFNLENAVEQCRPLAKGEIPIQARVRTIHANPPGTC